MSGFAGDVFGATTLVDSAYNGTRIEFTDTDTVTLTAFLGSFILVARGAFDATAFSPLLKNSNAMAANGTSAGVPIATDTLLYVYACTNVTDFPMILAASLTAPTQVGADWYLGTTGQALYARFVGCVYMKTGVFVDEPAARLVWNQWNRFQKQSFTCPRYSDGGARSSYSENTAVYAGMNGGSNNAVEYITGPTSGVLAGDANMLSLTCTIGSVPTAPIKFALGIDSTTDALASISFATGAAADASNSLAITVVGSNVWTKHTASMLVLTGGTAQTVVSDLAPGGGAHDPYATFLSGLVWC